MTIKQANYWGKICAKEIESGKMDRISDDFYMICPWCGSADSNLGDYKDGYNWCNECGLLFSVETVISKSYVTRRVEEK